MVLHSRCTYFEANSLDGSEAESLFKTNPVTTTMTTAAWKANKKKVGNTFGAGEELIDLDSVIFLEQNEKKGRKKKKVK